MTKPAHFIRLLREALHEHREQIALGAAIHAEGRMPSDDAEAAALNLYQRSN